VRAIELYIDYDHVFRYRPVVVRPLSGSGRFLSGAGVSVGGCWDGWMGGLGCVWLLFYSFVGAAGQMDGWVERGIIRTGLRGGVE